MSILRRAYDSLAMELIHSRQVGLWPDVWVLDAGKSSSGFSFLQWGQMRVVGVSIFIGVYWFEMLC